MKTILLYDGPIEPDGDKFKRPEEGIWAFQLARHIFGIEQDKYHIIDETERMKLLMNVEWRQKMVEALGLEKAYDVMYGSLDAQGKRLPGLLDETYAEFAETLSGVVEVIAPFPSPHGAFVEYQFGKLISNPKITTINGLDRQVYQDIASYSIGKMQDALAKLQYLSFKKLFPDHPISS